MDALHFSQDAIVATMDHSIDFSASLADGLGNVSFCVGTQRQRCHCDWWRS
jgi:hypothetical protein